MMILAAKSNLPDHHCSLYGVGEGDRKVFGEQEVSESEMDSLLGVLATETLLLLRLSWLRLRSVMRTWGRTWCRSMAAVNTSDSDAAAAVEVLLRGPSMAVALSSAEDLPSGPHRTEWKKQFAGLTRDGHRAACRSNFS